MKKLTILLFFATGLISLMALKHKDQSCYATDEKLYYGFRGGLVRFIPKGEVEVLENVVIFRGGMDAQRIDRDELNRLFPDSIYPLSREFKNDSLVESRIGLPVGRKRYHVADVNTAISGEGGMMLEGIRENGDYTFMFSRERKPMAGVVQIKGTNMYFINP